MPDNVRMMGYRIGMADRTNE